MWNGAETQIKSTLKKTDLERAIAAAIKTIQESEKQQNPQDLLFFHYSPDKVPHFLEQFFNDSGVQEELQRPLKNQGKPQIPFLVEALKRVAEASNVKLNQPSLEP